MTTSRFAALFRRRSETAVDEKTPPGPQPDPAADTASALPPGPDGASADPDAKAGEAKPGVLKFGLDAILPSPPSGKAAAASRMVEGDRKKPARATVSDKVVAWRGQVAAADGRTLAATAAVFLALGTGWIAGRVGGEHHGATALAGTTLTELRRTHDQVSHLTSELRGLRGVVETLRGERDGPHDAEPLARELTERLDRTGQENATRIGRLTEQLDRIEKTGREALRLSMAAADAAKPDKAEKVGAASSGASGKNPDPIHTGSIAPSGEARAELDPRKVRLEGFVLRDYDDGFALIETRSGRFLEVAVGHSLPGVGRVDAIERRGRQWVVITSKGFIGER